MTLSVMAAIARAAAVLYSATVFSEPGYVSRETFFIIYAFLKHVGLNVLRILFNVNLRKNVCGF